MSFYDLASWQALYHMKGVTVLTKTAAGTAASDIPEGYELFEGQPMKVLNGERSGWWRFHNHYDRDGYCDNPARGY